MRQQYWINPLPIDEQVNDQASERREITIFEAEEESLLFGEGH